MDLRENESMDFMCDKRPVLITGGAGFIGSHLCLAYLHRGEKVVCLDNLSSGSRDNIAPFLHHPLFTFIEHDVTNPLLDIDCWLILNLACPASPVFYQRDPITTTKANVLGILHVLELAKKQSARLVQASTSEVYGDPTETPQREEYWGNVNPHGIRSCYDEGKRLAESLCFDYYRTHGLDIRIVRIFNTYGPGMAVDDGRVVSNFLSQALEGKPLTVYGTGNQTRSFCYISDLVEGIVQLADLPATGTPIVMNLGNDTEFTILELAAEVLRQSQILDKTETPLGLVGQPSFGGYLSKTILFLPLPEDDPKKRKPDLTRARSLLPGWDPRVGLSAGIAKSLRYLLQKKEEDSTSQEGEEEERKCF